MKKIVLVTTIILIISTLFLSGCSAAVQDTLQSRWQDYEKYIYEVSLDNAAIGTLTLESTRNKSLNGVTPDVTIGESTYNNLIGTKIRYELKINDSADSIISEVFFSTRFAPIYSHKTIIRNDITTTIDANYSGDKYNYKTTVNGEETTGVIGLKAPFYDNEMVYYILRSADMSDNKFSFTFNVPSPLEEKAQSITTTLSQTVEVGGIMDNKVINSYEVTMITNQKIKGEPYKLYYSTRPITVEDKQIDSVLVRFVENNYVYNLQSITTIPDVQE